MKGRGYKGAVVAVAGIGLGPVVIPALQKFEAVAVSSFNNPFASLGIPSGIVILGLIGTAIICGGNKKC